MLEEPGDHVVGSSVREAVEHALVGHAALGSPDDLVPAAGVVEGAKRRRVGHPHRVGRAEVEEHRILDGRTRDAEERAARYVRDGGEALGVRGRVVAEVRRAAAVADRDGLRSAS